MPLCYKLECVKDATRILNGNWVCDLHYLKEKVALYKANNVSKVSIEFCVWIQDTDVFSTFTDHLNKGLQLKDLDINEAKPKVLKAKA